MEIDIQKIALFLSWKLPPYYGGNKKVKFIKQLWKIDKETYSNENIDFFQKQSRDLEEFYFMVLDDYISENKKIKWWDKNISKLLNDLDLPPEMLWENEKTVGIDIKKEWEKFKNELKWIKIEFKKEELSERNKEAKIFEDFTGRLVKFLFKDSFNDFYLKEQPQTINKLDIRDFMLMNNYKNENSAISSFWWDIIKNDYNSSFVTIECKNYKDEAGQEPIITTLKYLEKTNIGRFWIIFTRKGLNDEWIKKQIDLLKWQQNKLSICLLVLDDDDINNLIDLKIRWEKIEKYLLDKYFDLQTKI